MEFCDVVDATGRRTGRTVARGTTLEPGEFYMVVHIWIRDEEGNFLIQERHPSLAADPGVWATTAGYVTSGEDGRTAAVREVGEEIGLVIAPQSLQHFGRRPVENRLADIWTTTVSRASATVVIGPEVADWKWVDGVSLRRMFVAREFHPYVYFQEMVGGRPETRGPETREVTRDERPE